MEQNNSRLNHFILWCKGWYQEAPIITTNYEEFIKSKNRNRTSFDMVKEILKLDGYMFVRTNSDVLSILLNYIDDLVDKGILSGNNELRMLNWNSNIQKYMSYNNDYETSVLRTIHDLFAYSISSEDFELSPPVYNKKVYKMGFVGPRHLGNSYKMLNHKVKKIFNKTKTRHQEYVPHAETYYSMEIYEDYGLTIKNL